MWERDFNSKYLLNVLVIGSSSGSGSPAGIISGTVVGAVLVVLCCVIVLLLLRWYHKKKHSSYGINNESVHVTFNPNPAYGKVSDLDYSSHQYELVEDYTDNKKRDSVEMRPNPSYKVARRLPKRPFDSAIVNSSGVQNPSHNIYEVGSSEGQYDYVIRDTNEDRSHHNISESSYLSVIAD